MLSRTRLSVVRSAVAVFVTMAIWASTTAAETPGTAAPTNPVGQFFQAANPMNWPWPKFKAPAWKMPQFGQMMPSSSDQQRIVKKKDSLFSDVGTTAKKSWNKTKEVFSPQNLNPMRLVSSPKSTTDQEAEKPQSESPGFFGSLFQSPAPSERVANVNDFLNQDRPAP